MKEYTVREFSKILKQNGWERSCINGSHAIYRKKGKTPIVVPVIRKCISMPLAKRLIKEHGLLGKEL